MTLLTNTSDSNITALQRILKCITFLCFTKQTLLKIAASVIKIGISDKQSISSEETLMLRYADGQRTKLNSHISLSTNSTLQTEVFITH